MGRMRECLGASMLLFVMIMSWDGVPRVVEAQQFGLVHGYAHLEGSPAKSEGKGVSPEYHEIRKAHDRRRLAAVLDFPLRGDDNVYLTGLYYTQITLGTPPRQYYVMVDTGSDVMWLNCVPCPSCPLETGLAGIKLTQYDPSKSSTDKVLSCTDSDCETASYGKSLQCTNSPAPEACGYSILYGDGSSTNGYFIQDVLTFNQVENSTNSNGTANIYFGCGINQTGNLQSTLRARDGLIGFGSAAIAVPTQLANQKKTGRVFAHCLQGDDQGGGTLVIGNIVEPDITYTPIVPQQSHYSVKMENIAVNGMNVTTPASFAITPREGGGVIIDSGTTLSYLAQPAFSEFVAAISSNAPVRPQQIVSSGLSDTCFFYSGQIVGAFPEVKLFFDGGAVMNLGPKNYLYKLLPTQGGQTAWCLGWMESSSPQPGYLSYTIFGDIVLKDHLVVYDNDKQRVGWRSFDCTKPISVSTPNSTDAMTVLPGSGSPGSGSPGSSQYCILWFCSGAQGLRARMSTYLISCCLAFVFLCAML